ncbi:beta strand repeat-containing protein [Vibrio mediterranei]|uniref:beta strand repeat-containing protein n=1 Tax=Vibrio mediterranei TaxID=689 RepID=UPI00148B7C4C|nr:Ig-like domain-containing protein [Vibrio mediterranei]NOI24150.1 hypothetical protein [Vibrio mediterranei]
MSSLPHLQSSSLKNERVELSTDDHRSLASITGIDHGLERVYQLGGSLAVFPIDITAASVPLVASSDISLPFQTDPISVAAQGGNGHLVYRVDKPAIASIDRNKGLLKLLAVGEFIVTVTDTGNGVYSPQTAQTKVMVVPASGGNVLDVGNDKTVVYGAGPYVQIATGGNGGDVTYDSSDKTVAIVNKQGQVNILRVGATVITATEAAGNYLSQSDSYHLTVVPASGGSVLDAGNDKTVTYGSGNYTQVATGGNGGNVTYDSSDKTVATVNKQGQVTILKAGSTVITAMEAAGNYISQSDSYHLTVMPASGGNALDAGKDKNVVYGSGPYVQVATGGNGGDVTYESSDKTVATVNNQGKVTILKVGTTIITVTEAKGNYVSQSDSYHLNVTPASVGKTSGGTALDAGSDKAVVYGTGGYIQVATGGNGGDVTYDSSDKTVATVNKQGQVNILKVGTTVITAIEAAGNYLSQSDSYHLTVTPASGGTTLDAGNDKTVMYGSGNYDQVATGGNGGDVTYDSSDTTVATVNKQGQVTILKVGSTVITAMEAAGNYVSQSDSYHLTVTPASGGNTLDAGGDKTLEYGSGTYVQVATGGNGGDVTYESSDKTVATVNKQGQVTILKVGATVITAVEAPGNYISQSDSYHLTVIPSNGGNALDAGIDKIVVYGSGTYIQAATGGNGGDVTYDSSDKTVATVNKQGQVTILKTGNTNITATEAVSNYASQSDSYYLKVIPASGGTRLDVGNDKTVAFGSGTYVQIATGGNGGDVTYDSSDKTVATVDKQGRVTILKAGVTTITATEAASNYVSQSDSYQLTVTPAKSNVTLKTIALKFDGRFSAVQTGNSSPLGHVIATFDDTSTNDVSSLSNITVLNCPSCANIRMVSSGFEVDFLQKGIIQIQAVYQGKIVKSANIQIIDPIRELTRATIERLGNQGIGGFIDFGENDLKVHDYIYHKVISLYVHKVTISDANNHRATRYIVILVHKENGISTMSRAEIRIPIGAGYIDPAHLTVNSWHGSTPSLINPSSASVVLAGKLNQIW